MAVVTNSPQLTFEITQDSGEGNLEEMSLIVTPAGFRDDTLVAIEVTMRGWPGGIFALDRDQTRQLAGLLQGLVAAADAVNPKRKSQA